MTNKLHVLVIDDEPAITSLVATVLREEDWEVTETDSAERAIEMLRQEKWSVVFCDVQLGGADGFSVLRRFKEELPATKVVLMTGHGSASGALDATSFGAYDYLLKPFGPDELQLLSRALREQLLGHDAHGVPAVYGVEPQHANEAVLGRSEAFISVMKQVGRVAATNLPVLLIGESGTGKEVVASSLHRRSGRANQRFVAVNCGAISAELIESELFGHVKGSFTGAERDRTGLWEEANKGTVFLDEITETTAAFQVKLLRALQQGEIRRVGSNQTQRVDVRVIAASNRNVEAEVEAGRFRQDLFYRLNAVTITLPPLRERKEDILLLTKSFADRTHSLSHKVGFSLEALQLLERYPWPGNIRELENAVVRAAAMCGGTVRPEDLPIHIRNYQLPSNGDAAVESTELPERAVESWPTLSSIEGDYLKRVLDHTKGNKQAAARILNVDRKTIERMILRHRIDNNHKGNPA